MIMEIESIQFRYPEKTIVLTMTDGTVRTYTEVDKAQYLADTGRDADIAAIGWA